MEGRQQRLQWSNVREGVNETMAVTAGSDSGYKRSDNRDGSDSGDRVAVAGATSATDTVAIEAKQRQLQHQRRWRWQQAPTTAKGAALTVEAATGNGDGNGGCRQGTATSGRWWQAMLTGDRDGQLATAMGDRNWRPQWETATGDRNGRPQQATAKGDGDRDCRGLAEIVPRWLLYPDMVAWWVL